MYLMKVISEAPRVHLILNLRFHFNFNIIIKLEKIGLIWAGGGFEYVSVLIDT